MMNLFKKLDRMAEQWIATLDGELQEPVVRAVTGEVFTHGTEDPRSMSVLHLKADEPQRGAYQAFDVVAETLNPPLTIPVMPQASISTQVT